MANNNLANKAILLLSPSFFGYEYHIANKIKEMGGDVVYINDDPSNLFLFIKGVLEKLHIGTDWMIHSFEDSVKKKLRGRRFDYIIVICGWAITSRLSGLLRQNHLSGVGKMLLYYWDSISLLGDDTSRWQYFDRIFTFDKKDYADYSSDLSFLPLFYIDTYCKSKAACNKDIDLFTVGSFKFNRYYEIETIRQKNPNIRIYSYMYESKWLIRFHKLFRPKYKSINLDNIKYVRISPEDIVNFYNRSYAILDIPRTGQNGLTMRTFECLAMEKKIVTTNPHIIGYGFYNSNNIYVMDTNNYILPGNEWFEREYVPLPKEVYERYSISNWLKKILFNE